MFSIDISKICLSDHLKCLTNSRNLCYGIRNNITCNVWHDAFSCMCQNIRRHLSCSVDTLITSKAIFKQWIYSLCSPNLLVCLQEPQCVPECQLSDLSDEPHLENSEAGMQLTSPPLTCCKPVSLLLWLHLLSGMDTVYMSIWGHTHTAPKGKLEVRGKRWHWITTKQENINTSFNYYGWLQMYFCIILRMFK